MRHAACLGVDWKQTACWLITWASNHRRGISGLSLALPIHIHSLCSSDATSFMMFVKPSVEGSCLTLSLRTGAPRKPLPQVSLPASLQVLWDSTSLTLHTPHFSVDCLLRTSFSNCLDLEFFPILTSSHWTLNEITGEDQRGALTAHLHATTSQSSCG